MAQRDLVAALRAYKAAETRLLRARETLDQEIRRGVAEGDWQIVDIAELTGWSRETIRKIATSVPADEKPRNPSEARGIRRPRKPSPE